jgi:hypothetical protein
MVLKFVPISTQLHEMDVVQQLQGHIERKCVIQFSPLSQFSTDQFKAKRTEEQGKKEPKKEPEKSTKGTYS